MSLRKLKKYVIIQTISSFSKQAQQGLDEIILKIF